MMGDTSAQSLDALLSPLAEAVEADLVEWLVEDGVPPELAEAMRYCVLGGGKRLRPALVLMSARAVGGSIGAAAARRSAVAIELVHCYSLVHDDLPGMDNDTLRRGRPTAHVKFGEAMAILAGDALLTRAFGVLGEVDQADLAGRLARELARAAGAAGMIAGQVADMDLCRLPPGQAGLEYIHRRKTADLIAAAVRMGAACGGADQRTMSALDAYGRRLGLTFQAVDDILDVVGQAEQIGKTPGKDAQAGKTTHVSMLGLDGAKAMARKLTDDALAAIEPLGSAGGELRRLAELLVERTS